MHPLLDANFWGGMLFEAMLDVQATMMQPVDGMDRIPYRARQRSVRSPGLLLNSWWEIPARSISIASASFVNGAEAGHNRPRPKSVLQGHQRSVSMPPVSALVEDPVPRESEINGFGHLEEVLQSESFKRAPTLRCLLLFLWKNRGKEISEYAIAVDALGRNRAFESKIDASVRVQISRLRQFLTKYYESEGSRSTSRLVVPLGTHQIQLIEVAPQSEPEDCRQDGPENPAEAADGIACEPVPPPPQLPATRNGFLVPVFLIPVLSAIIVVLALCVGWLLWHSTHQGGKNNVSAKQELPLFWKRFMANGKLTRIVLPTPVFFSWEPGDHSGSLFVRDISVNQFDQSENSAQIANLEKELGKPRLWQNYTVASDTFASLRLARFLDSYGVQTFFSSSAESPREIIDHENVIAFGTTSSLSAYQSDLDRLSYKLGPHEAYVIDERQPAGKDIQFPRQVESASRMIMPGLVALLPRGPSGSRILLVQAVQTMALISWMTSEEGMRELTQAQDEPGRGLYFEAVVLSEVNAGNPIQSRMVAFRPFIGENAQTDRMDTASFRGKPAVHHLSGPAVEP